MAKEGKEKKEKTVAVVVEVAAAVPEEVDYETRLESVSIIAHPLANKKLNKKVLKLVKKGKGTLLDLFQLQRLPVLRGE